MLLMLEVSPGENCLTSYAYKLARVWLCCSMVYRSKLCRMRFFVKRFTRQHVCVFFVCCFLTPHGSFLTRIFHAGKNMRCPRFYVSCKTYSWITYKRLGCCSLFLFFLDKSTAQLHFVRTSDLARFFISQRLTFFFIKKTSFLSLI